MDCKHPYFRMVDGKLYCSQCGKSADDIKAEAQDRGHTEDKIDQGHETKIWPPEVTRRDVRVEKKATKPKRGRPKGKSRGKK